MVEGAGAGVVGAAGGVGVDGGGAGRSGALLGGGEEPAADALAVIRRGDGDPIEIPARNR